MSISEGRSLLSWRRGRQTVCSVFVNFRSGALQLGEGALRDSSQICICLFVYTKRLFPLQETKKSCIRYSASTCELKCSTAHTRSCGCFVGATRKFRELSAMFLYKIKGNSAIECARQIVVRSKRLERDSRWDSRDKDLSADFVKSIRIWKQ